MYNVLGMKYNPKRIIGTHMMRKTKLLLASIGNFKDEWTRDRSIRCATHHGVFAPSLCNDLRQKDAKTVMIYLGDSNTVATFRERHGGNILHNRVGPYNPIYIKCLDTWNSLYLAHGVKFNKKSLYDVSSWFLFEKLKIDEMEFNNGNLILPDLINTVTNYTVVKCVPKEETVSLETMISTINQHMAPAYAPKKLLPSNN